MKVTGIKVLSLVAGAVVGGWLLAPSQASATLAYQKKAKELGIASVTNCQSCHIDKLPKKESHKFSERGQWLSSHWRSRR